MAERPSEFATSVTVMAPSISCLLANTHSTDFFNSSSYDANGSRKILHIRITKHVYSLSRQRLRSSTTNSLVCSWHQTFYCWTMCPSCRWCMYLEDFDPLPPIVCSWHQTFYCWMMCPSCRWCMYLEDFDPLPPIVCLSLPSDFLLLDNAPFLSLVHVFGIIYIHVSPPHHRCLHLSND